MKLKFSLLAIFPAILTACSVGSGGSAGNPQPYEKQAGEKRVVLNKAQQGGNSQVNAPNAKTNQSDKSRQAAKSENTTKPETSEPAENRQTAQPENTLKPEASVPTENSQAEKAAENTAKNGAVATTEQPDEPMPVRLSFSTHSSEKPEKIDDWLVSLAALNKQQGNTETSCRNATKSACHRDVAADSALISYQRSYTLFGAVRNAYLDSAKQAIDGKPANTFVAMTQVPTTDRTAIVDATYHGKVAYSRQNRPAITLADLTMQVKGEQISGSVIEKSGTGKISDVMTFKPAQIQASAEKIAFEGEAQFHQAGFGREISGRYNGLFAGKKGEELIGTFHSNSTDKENSVQGAMSATRQ